MNLLRRIFSRKYRLAVEIEKDIKSKQKQIKQEVNYFVNNSLGKTLDELDMLIAKLLKTYND